MRGLVEGLTDANLALFLALALASLRLWRRRRGPAGYWATLAFGALALIAVLGQVAPTRPHGLGETALQRVDVAILVLFPYLLYRFATAFERPPRVVSAALAAATAALVVWTFALPSFPAPGQAWRPAFAAYVVLFVLDWALLSALGAWRLWRSGRAQPSVVRRRMRLLAAAAGGLTVALILAASTPSPQSALEAAAQAVALAAALAFLLGLAPPPLVRLAWRAPEQRRLQDAIERLVTLATRREEVVERVLPPMAALVGARRVLLRDDRGEVLGEHVPAGAAATGGELLELEVPGGSLEVWTSPYAPFFGEEELALLQTLGALTGIALDRVRLFVQERDARVALERANEVMTNFVSLAAHELRTPVTTIHGFVHTLNHLGDRLAPEQREELSRTLEQQTARMASLVEQLLDLSRLDAEAVEIVPRRIRVRDRLVDVVQAAAPAVEAVVVEAPAELEVSVDEAAFDRIVTNLLTNALRYGEPPVTVRAEQTDRHFRVFVEDCGGGVPAEFVPDLFERFRRSDASRERATGTGLGLAIARSYARAHGGDLLYEPALPRGARFQFVLPTGVAPAGR